MQISLRFLKCCLPILAVALVSAACGSPSNSLTSSDPAPATSSPSTAAPCQAEPLPIGAQATLNSQTIRLEVARTSDEQQLGLMCRDQLPLDQGMIFLFEPARPVSFWMFQVRFPLDIIFVRNQVVVGIAANVPGCPQQPCQSYGPGRDVAVDLVLELNGGQAAALGLAPGDPLVIEFLDN